eukprot:scaffold28486_cov55-Phaeocystis_antarctica.AAC.2
MHVERPQHFGLQTLEVLPEPPGVVFLGRRTFPVRLLVLLGSAQHDVLQLLLPAKRVPRNCECLELLFDPPEEPLPLVPGAGPPVLRHAKLGSQHGNRRYALVSPPEPKGRRALVSALGCSVAELAPWAKQQSALLELPSLGRKGECTRCPSTKRARKSLVPADGGITSHELYQADICVGLPASSPTHEH